MPRITRRDFLDGARIAITGAALGPWLGCSDDAATPPSAPYPPALQGMRGSAKGSFEVAHALVAGQRFERSGTATGETFDLVIAGAGISGLSAAYFYRKAQPDARILLIENHDDFGGHAQRNEFETGGTLRIGYGGTQSIDTPSEYSDVSMGLLRELGIDVARFERAFDRELYAKLGMGWGVFFPRESFGTDRLVPGYGALPWAEFAEQTPLAPEARADLTRLHTERRDYLPGLSPAQKEALLERTSYADFLREHARVHPEVQKLYRRFWISYYATGGDAFPAAWIAREPMLPGLQSTHHIPGHVDEPYIFHFPDGNASIARLLVRSLVPSALPGHTMEDVVTARADYAQLDRPEHDVRLRLRSTVVDVRHAEGGAAVDVAYVRDGKVETVRGNRCVLACYNTAIPYLCAELPEPQKRGLAWSVKAPLVYVNTLVRSWRAFERLGVDRIHAPESFYALAMLDFPVSLGDYAHPSSPDEPILVHLDHVPYHPEVEGPEQWRAGRRTLLATPFAVYEQQLREQLDRMLGPGGFDAERDLLAITVNRWPHGYAREPNTLWDGDWEGEDEPPWVVGRRRHGRIAIANSDAGASAYTDAAIDEAYRAVGELLDG